MTSPQAMVNRTAYSTELAWFSLVSSGSSPDRVIQPYDWGIGTACDFGGLEDAGDLVGLASGSFHSGLIRSRLDPTKLWIYHLLIG